MRKIQAEVPLPALPSGNKYIKMKLLRYLLILPFLMLLFGKHVTFGQQRQVLPGVVLQPDGVQPVPHASILNINTKKGVVANEQGTFLMEISAADSLLVRAVGYKTKLFTMADGFARSHRMDFVLQEDTLMLGEVEVIGLPSLQQLKHMKLTLPDNVRKNAFPPAPEPQRRLPSPDVGGPIGALYNVLSKEGKEIRMYQELQQKEKEEEERKEQERYNSYFKDNEGIDE